MEPPSHANGERVRYQRAWRDYWRRWWLMWGLFFGFVPCGVAASNLLPTIAAEVLVAWAVGLAMSALAVGLFRCPACGRCFHQTWWWGNPFSRRCLHCGLRKWSTEPPKREQLAL